MNKISVIIKREYVTRVRKRSFIIMTLLAPLLMGGIIAFQILTMTSGDREFKRIVVITEKADLFRNSVPNTKEAEFIWLENANVEDLKKTFVKAGYYGILVIYPELVSTPNAIQLISKNQPPIGLLEHIERSLEKEIERQKLLAYKINNLDEIMKSIKTSVSVQTVKIDETGAVKQTSTGISMALAYLGGFLMYMLVFMFGAQVMRGVIEEKTSRIVEVVISSVKPVQLMMGKIIGVALVGLTQFMIWIILTTGVVMVAKSYVMPGGSDKQITQSIIARNLMTNDNQQQANAAVSNVAVTNPSEMSKLFTSAMNQPWGLLLICFVFYFITGYLLYASVFAAIGSAVDNETETQQFMLPVTIPIILALFVAMSVMQNPESSLVFWFSLIPLFSPIVMIARIPFMAPDQYWQIAVSMLLMVITFLAFVWMAAKIYRTGILMYGKKASWKEMWKWLMYKG